MNKYIELGATWPKITYYAEDDPFSLLYGSGDVVVVAVSHDFDGTEIGIASRLKKRWVERMTPDDLLMICNRLAYAITARQGKHERSKAS